MVLFVLLFLTACTPKYQATIHDGTIDEKITFTVDSLTSTSASDNQENNIKTTNYYAYPEYIEENKYKKEITKTDKGYLVTLTYTHTAEKFKDALAIQYFKYPVYINTEDYIFFKLQGGLKEGMQNQLSSEGAEITMTADNQVITHNADYVKGNTYTWKLTKYNASQKEIIFQVSKKKKQVLTPSKGNTIILVILIVGLTGGSTFLLWYLGQKLIRKRF